MKLDNILVIADRDDPNQVAARAALELLPAAAGRLHIVGFVYEHAAEEPGVLSATAAATLKDASLVEKQQWLQQSMAALQLGARQAQVETVWAKDIVDWTHEAVAREDIHLVAKTATRRGSLFYTPTEWHLLRRCPVPVLMASNSQREKRRRILATVDAGSSDPIQIGLNRKVLAAAAQLGAQLEAQVHAVYVIPVSVVAKDLDLIDAKALERTAREKHAAPLAAMAGEFGIPARNILIKAGQPDRVIPSMAARLKVDTVVMGTVGRTGVAGKVLGNTAEQVLQRLRTSMLAL